MASSFAERGVPRAPPPADQLAAFYKLVNKGVLAAQLCRNARALDLSLRAIEYTEALFGDDSLVVARLQMNVSTFLGALAVEASRAEGQVLFARSTSVVLLVVNLLLRRLENNTLLPGTIREEETDFEAHGQVAISEAMRERVPPTPDAIHGLASTMGYGILLGAMFRGLDYLPSWLWSVAQKRTVRSFILQGLDVIPQTDGIPAKWIAGESSLVAAIAKMDPHDHDPIFYASMLRKWRSDAVCGVLRARGVLQTGTAKHKKNNAGFEGRKRADIAKHGLRDCALPSCDKTEKTVKEFSLCAGCRSQVYCCLEHQALDWSAHKRRAVKKRRNGWQKRSKRAMAGLQHHDARRKGGSERSVPQ